MEELGPVMGNDGTTCDSLYRVGWVCIQRYVYFVSIGIILYALLVIYEDEIQAWNGIYYSCAENGIPSFFNLLLILFLICTADISESFNYLYRNCEGHLNLSIIIFSRSQRFWRVGT